MDYAKTLKSHCAHLSHPLYPRIEDLHDCVFNMKITDLPSTMETQQLKTELLEIAINEGVEELWCVSELYAGDLLEKYRSELSDELYAFMLEMNAPKDLGDCSEDAIKHYKTVTLPLKNAQR